MAPNDRESRQVAIKGWNQAALETTVVVYGREWAGTLAVLGLSMLGMRRIIWLGPPCPNTQSLAAWILSDSFGAEIWDFPIALEFGSEIDWLCTSAMPRFFVICTDNPRQWALASNASENFHAQRVSVTGSCGGWLTYNTAPPLRNDVAFPPLSLALAAMAVDVIREWAMNPSQPVLPKPGSLRWRTCKPSKGHHLILVGAGGIGSWLLLGLLAAAAGNLSVSVVDDDTVAEHNRNRQLYTAVDAQRSNFKAEALTSAMKNFFSEAEVCPQVRRVTPDYFGELFAGGAEPSLLISAVDNAQTRLVLQDFGSNLRSHTAGKKNGMPILQAATDIWAADVFVQAPDGPTLDQQLFGQLSAAAERERNRPRQGGCNIDPSYVVPSMMAGAMSAYATLRVLGGERVVGPIRWRAGTKPTDLGASRGELNLNTIASRARAANC